MKINRRTFLTGLGAGIAVTLPGSSLLATNILIHGWRWALLNTSMDWWYLLENVGLVAIPCFLFFQGARYKNLLIIRTAAILTMLCIILNRLNISIIAFKCWLPFSERYYPSWMEIAITLAIILTEVWVFRWVVNRMPVFGNPPAWAEETH